MQWEGSQRNLELSFARLTTEQAPKEGESTLMIDVIDHEVSAAPTRTLRAQGAPGGNKSAKSSGISTHRPTHHTAVVVLLPLRLFLAAGWLRASAEKLIDRQWWTGAKLRSFLT